MTDQPGEGPSVPLPDSPWGAPSPGYVPPPPAYAPPLPAYGQPPPGYAPPPPGYGQQPPGYGQPPPPTWPTYGQPYGPGPGSYPPPPNSTNLWAVVALVTGIIGLVPVAIGAGITALVQIPKRGQGGKGIAIAGIVVAGAWVVIGALVVVSFVFAGGSSGALGRVADAGSTRVGSCLGEPTSDDSLATTVDCAKSHDAELYVVQNIEGTDWPGYDPIDGHADDICQNAFQGYVGTPYDDSDYDYGYFLPDQGEWAAGERRVACVVLPGLEDSLRGSVRGSRR